MLGENEMKWKEGYTGLLQFVIHKWVDTQNHGIKVFERWRFVAYQSFV